jgi:hypothetical protein
LAYFKTSPQQNRCVKVEILSFYFQLQRNHLGILLDGKIVDDFFDYVNGRLFKFSAALT